MLQTSIKIPRRPPCRVGYVLKRYPRYSETFVVNEILAHEAAGESVEIFSLRPTVDSHFQDLIARVQAPVQYCLAYHLKGRTFWRVVEETSTVIPDIWAKLSIAQGEAVEDIYQALLIARTARLHQITHLHAHFATSATSVARLASHFSGIPYSFTAHAKDIFHESVEALDFRRKLRDAIAVVTVSDYNLAYLQTTYGHAAAKVTRIYNGLDLSQLPFQPPVNRPPTILAVGRLVEKKGFKYLISACRLLAERGVEFHCQIVGIGELEKDLRSRITQLQLDEQVTLLGPRPQQDLIPLIQQAAVFAAPCVVGQDGNRDGLPTVLLEAMALGTPCVSTPVTGIPEIIQPEKTGLLVPQADPVALAHALTRLLAEGDLRVALATAANTLITREFDSHRNSLKIRHLWQGESIHALPSTPPQLQEVVS